MKSLKLIPLILLILVACKDSVSTTEPDAGTTIIGSIGQNKCDNDAKFDGATSVSEITDTSVKLAWPVDTNSFGYTIFEIKNGKYEMIKSVVSNTTELTVSNLDVETDYQFAVRTLNEAGALDCNTKQAQVRTLQKQTFISCNEIKTYYSGVKPSGYYQIDSDATGPNPAYQAYCEMENNNGGWTRVFTHKTSAGLFSNRTDAILSNLDTPSADKYSILSKLEEFKRDGKFEFWIYYPEVDAVGAGNIWTQTSNPINDTIANYVSIREEHNGQHWGGLEKSSYSGTLINGSVGHGWWFYAIGSYRHWPSNGTIPGPLRNQGVTEVQLFIR